VDEVLCFVSKPVISSFVFVNTYTLHGVVEITSLDDIAIQQTTLGPPYLPTSLLVDEQPAPQLLGLDFEETSKLLEVHGGVELEVALDGRRHHVVLNLVHENAEVVLDRVDVDLWVVKVGRGWADELGASGAEELLEQGKGVRATTLQPVELFAVLFPQRGMDGVVESGGLESHADGDKCVHLVVLLGDGVVLGVLLEVLCPRDIDEDVAEHADGIRVPSHHHVGESDVVVGGEVCRHDTRKHGLLVELDVVERLERQTEVSEQAVDAEQTNDGEVAQHLVQRPVAVLSRIQARVLAPLHCRQLLTDL